MVKVSSSRESFRRFPILWNGLPDCSCQHRMVDDRDSTVETEKYCLVWAKQLCSYLTRFYCFMAITKEIWGCRVSKAFIADKLFCFSEGTVSSQREKRDCWKYTYIESLLHIYYRSSPKEYCFTTENAVICRRRTLPPRQIEWKVPVLYWNIIKNGVFPNRDVVFRRM